MRMHLKVIAQNPQKCKRREIQKKNYHGISNAGVSVGKGDQNNEDNYLFKVKTNTILYLHLKIYTLDKKK